jgi:hypothetical protein
MYVQIQRPFDPRLPRHLVRNLRVALTRRPQSAELTRQELRREVAAILG